MSVRSRSNWNLEELVFKERGKLEYLEENLSEERREPTTNSTQIWRQHQDSNPGHTGGGRVLSPLRNPSFPNILMSMDATLYFHLLQSICTVTQRVMIFMQGFHI